MYIVLIFTKIACCLGMVYSGTKIILVKPELDTFQNIVDNRKRDMNYAKILAERGNVELLNNARNDLMNDLRNLESLSKKYTNHNYLLARYSIGLALVEVVISFENSPIIPDMFKLLLH